MTREDLQSLRPGDVVLFRDVSSYERNRHKPAIVVRVEGDYAWLRLENGKEIRRMHQHLTKEGVKT